MKKIIFTISVIVLAAAAVLFFTAEARAPKLINAGQTSQKTDLTQPVDQPKGDSQEVSLLAVGDIMLSRNVAAQIRAHNNDSNFPFENIAAQTSDADISYANLECPITAGPIVPTGSMIFHADPGAEQGLKYAGFDILQLANNHTPNYGQQGLLDTFKYLTGAGLKYVGAGKNETEADAPLIYEAKGYKFAFLAYNDADVVPANYFADATHAGTNEMTIAKVQRDVAAAKKIADFVVVGVHSGTEYKAPNQHQIDFDHAAIDAGADIVIGGHPHVLQPVEKYKGKFILYSMGNFVFDQYFSKQTSESAIAKIYFNKSGVERIEFTPVLISRQSQPEVAQDQQTKDEVLKQLNISSFVVQ